MAVKEEVYYSPTLGRLPFSGVIDEIVAMMAAAPGDIFSIVVGTDSQTYYGEAEYVTAIVVHRVGRGGRYFWRRIIERKPRTMRDRIWREAWLSYETAQALIQAFKARGIFDCRLEIHVDIGWGGRTRDLVEEVVNAIRGSGFFVRTKPEAYAASVVADKHTK